MEKIPLDLQESSLFMRRKIAANQAQERSDGGGGGGGGGGGSSQLLQFHHPIPPPQPIPFQHTTTSQPLSRHHAIFSQPLPQHRAISSRPQPQYPIISSHSQAQQLTVSSHPVPQHVTITSHKVPVHHTASQPHPVPQQGTDSNPTFLSLFPSRSLSRPQHLPLKNIASPFPLQSTSNPQHNESGYGALLTSSKGCHSETHNVTLEFPPPPMCIPPPKPPRQLQGIQAQTDISPQQNDFTKIKEDKGRLRKEVKDKYLANLDLGQAVNEEPPDFSPPPPTDASLHSMSIESMSCTRCGDGFEPQEKIVNSNGQLWHTQCFVCAQCFRPFPDDIFYEFEGRKYCEHDFQVLFAPCCNKCNEFIIGRVIKAMASNWHPQCFTCELCHKELADLGFIRNAGRALCHECNARIKAESQGKYMCHKCHSTIDGQPLRWRGDTFHPYHFNCAACGVELTADAREVKSRPGYTANEMNELYCLRCHDKMGIPICGACRRPIEERVVTALGKHWHVEHFVCAKCEKPFMGNRHYERKGLAYCETHYHELFGNLCFVCNTVIYGDVVTALNKAWCQHHFACATCDSKMTQKTKFFEFDQKPICKKCYEKFPQELKKRLKKQHDIQARGGKPLP